MKNFALVYLVDNDYSGLLIDVGNDPCFDNPPSWGICRPNIRNRKELDTGSRLLFIARVFKDNLHKYYLKGYFKVKSKINIIEAHQYYCTRQNVIISTSIKCDNNKWDNKNWKKEFSKKSFIEPPDFITQFKYLDKIFYQKTSDIHGVDNWKCRRIYNCKINSFKKCLEKNTCIKELSDLKKNYVLGEKTDFKDWSRLCVEWQEIAKLIDKSETLMKGNKHPEIELTNCEFDKIIKHMNSKKAVPEKP
jgi:hypothetical protein